MHSQVSSLENGAAPVKYEIHSESLHPDILQDLLNVKGNIDLPFDNSFVQPNEVVMRSHFGVFI